MVRDQMCRFPGCHRTRHLHAHHIVAWQLGGRTDLANLILLCERHHTYVHEGRLTITPTVDTTPRVVRAGGSCCPTDVMSIP